MNKTRTMRRFLADQSGATAIEYGLVAALITVALLVALGLLGGGISNMFNAVTGRATPVLDNASR
jgi:pilus assembly protein Flp/PilA